MSTDEDLMKLLLPQWRATLAWAEVFLCQTLGLARAQDVLKLRPRQQTIPGTNWTFRTHGKGVDLDRGFEVGGIDFDFGEPMPDIHRLHSFASKQYNAGNLPPEYRALIDDEGRFYAAARNVPGIKTD